MSTDKNFSAADNNDPQPPAEKQGASNNPENSQQEPKYTQLYGLEGTDGKMSLDPQASPEPQGAEGKEEPHKRISQQFDIDPNTREPLLIAQAIKNILIIIPALIILVVFVCVFINVLVSAPSGYVPFMLERILDPSSSAESSFTIVGVIAALYEVILGILMIVVTTNSIKKTTQLSGQKH